MTDTSDLIAFKPFQQEDFEFFLKHRRAGIWWEPRLGKTVLGTRLIFADVPRPKNVLIICPNNAIPTWIWHIHTIQRQYAPHVPFIIEHISRKPLSAATRQSRWLTKPPTGDGIKICIVTAGSFIADAKWLLGHKLVFDHIYIDEYHKWLKNRDTKSFLYIEQLARLEHVRFHPMSGTPAEKGPHEFWTVLHICNRHYFSSYWKFYNTFIDSIPGAWGGREILGLKNLEAFHMTLQRFGRIRKRKDVAPQMPKVVRRKITLPMTPYQQQLYNQFDAHKIAAFDDGSLVVAASDMEKLIRLRQLLCDPGILASAGADADELTTDSVGAGAALTHLTETLLDASCDAERHVVVYTPFRRSADRIVSHLRQNGVTNVFQLAGGITPEEQTAAIDGFARTKGVMVCTTKYAQAFSLASAQVCYHIGFEWSPTDQKQAEDRLVPQQGDYNILSYYYCHEGTIDEQVAEWLCIKDYMAETLTSGESPTNQPN